ncbi:hypothetical protein HAX54_011194 [Datura stramonium]|uniref:DUF4219 domain-containing protein n=1 Tax=Datura stramonium TaxID=4076 RepID=A0ABS8TJD5_DATST|nr:hypothetical protein [Datura stramonium]
MSSMKFEIDRFSGHNNFNFWKIQMIALLRREGLIHTIDRKYPDGTLNSDKEKIKGDVLSVIQLLLAPNVFCDLVEMLPLMHPLCLILVNSSVELSGNENNEQVELPVEITQEKDQETQVDESKDADLEELAINEPYTIAKRRDKRQIRRPKRLIASKYDCICIHSCRRRD